MYIGIRWISRVAWTRSQPIRTSAYHRWHEIRVETKCRRILEHRFGMNNCKAPSMIAAMAVTWNKLKPFPAGHSAQPGGQVNVHPRYCQCRRPTSFRFNTRLLNARVSAVASVECPLHVPTRRLQLDAKSRFPARMGMTRTRLRFGLNFGGFGSALRLCRQYCFVSLRTL